MKTMKHISAIVAILLLGGCYPQGPEFSEDTDVVYTVFDEDYDFQAANTYAMPDKIVVDVKVDNGDTTYVYMKDVFAGPIFQVIEKNMTAYGYTRVDIDETPTLLLTPAGLESTNYFYSYWYDWWYGGWYGGYWGWYYPPYYTISSYTTGSMIMVLSDPNKASDSPINRSRASWVAAANGLVNYAYDITRVTKSIDQAFAQSPYLNTK